MLPGRLVLFTTVIVSSCRGFTVKTGVILSNNNRHNGNGKSWRTTIIRNTTPTLGIKKTTTTKILPSSSTTIISSSDDDTCEIGTNTVNQCSTIPGTQSKISATTNIAKCICGAGSFALPHVFLEEGVLGGTLAITTCGVLATYTMRSLARSTAIASRNGGMGGGGQVTSYVQLAEVALNRNVASLVFFLTLSASIGVCSTYLVFIGQTLSSLSNDTESLNIVRRYLPDIPTATWEMAAVTLLYPLSLLRSYGIFAFTSALGVFAVLGGILVTLAFGIYVDPGGGLTPAFNSVAELPLWPTSLAQAFGGSFGTIAYLFCINFLTYPIYNSMENKEEYGEAVGVAVAGVWVVNVVFAVLCLGFYGAETQDLVLGNLDNGPYLSALKLLLCVDLLFTFPIVFSSGRQILENALLGSTEEEEEEVVVVDGTITTTTGSSSTSSEPTTTTALLTIKRAGIVAVAIAACFSLAQIGGFGAVANLVGGVAQGTLAFIIPPAIAVSLSRRNDYDDDDDGNLVGGEFGQFLLAAFGVAVVTSVTYFTLVGILSSVGGVGGVGGGGGE